LLLIINLLVLIYCPVVAAAVVH